MGNPTERVPIDLGERSYDIFIGEGLLLQPGALDGLAFKGRAFIVTNGTVAPLYEQRLRALFAGRHRHVDTVVLPDGEAHKQWQTLNLIFDALLGSACDRQTVLYALGGGVIGDMTGFAASCYMRGIDYVQVPTTLLAQVDSSVGGKTAINHPLGKNMIGSFYQPLRVLADLSTLATLPEREFAAGLAEIIKYGPIADVSFLDWIDANLSLLTARDPATLGYAVKRSCELKAWVVAQDERESGLRAILNFGHTFGHAIEAGMGYGTWLHGEAVASGMVMAADLSARLELIPQSLALRIRDIVRRAGLPIVGPSLPATRYLELMRVDKKSSGGEIRFVLLEGAGKAGIHTAPDALVAEVIHTHTAP